MSTPMATTYTQSSPRGSEWRRWDLHVHTASSYDYEYKGDDADAILVSSLKEKEITAIAITDHFKIDADRIKNIRDIALGITVFPGVELRTDKGASNIHVILIFSESIDIEILATDFSAIMLRDKAKNKDDENKIYWDYNDIVEFAKKRDALISVHTGKKTNGLDKEITNALEVNQAIKEEYAKTSHIFEIGNVSDIEPYKTLVFPSIKHEKPLILCSDNHDARSYNLKEYLWIKADRTFNGLKQILFEPEERVRISPTKPETKSDYLVIDRVEFTDNDFQAEPVFFSDKLSCIIGGKSTGKSILLHNLAQTIDNRQVKEKDLTSQTRTKKDVPMTVYWADGKNGRDNPSNDRKIIYVPQTYLNRLCDAQTERTEIDNIIQDIVLLNLDAKKVFEVTNLKIKNYKPDLEKTILDLLETHKAIDAIRAQMMEIGDKVGIEAEHKKLVDEKEQLAKASELDEAELKSYEDAVAQISALERKLTEVRKDIDGLSSLTSLVEPKRFVIAFSEKTKTDILTAQINALAAADSKWEAIREELLAMLNEQIAKANDEQATHQTTEERLRGKIQSNQAIAELTKKISTESDKLAKMEELSKQKIQKVNEKELLIKKVIGSIDSYKEYHQSFADAVNSNPGLKADDLDFSVEVPLRCEAFIGKLKEIMDVGRTVFKNIISPETFTLRSYTQDKIREIIEKVLAKELVLKGSNSPESAIRDILADWYEVKYKVSMSGDSIDTMSPGKKALVLLKLLIELAESKCPILVDQPEDDLDNRSIYDELIPFILKKKKDRQIIAVTHNANIVLGADAEQIIVANQQGNNAPNKEKRFEYRSGAIENDTPLRDVSGNVVNGVLNQRGVQQHICDILEGGERAFELRRNKYHM